MIDKTRLFAILYLAVLAGCTGTSTILPDGGPTTHDIWAGNYRQKQAETARRSSRDFTRRTSPLPSSLSSMSMTSTRSLETLDQDFREVPNPQIIAYVYPHFNAAELPVPGYFTAFRLYARNHYAKMEEKAAEGLSR